MKHVQVVNRYAELCVAAKDNDMTLSTSSQFFVLRNLRTRRVVQWCMNLAHVAEVIEAEKKKRQTP